MKRLILNAEGSHHLVQSVRCLYCLLSWVADLTVLGGRRKKVCSGSAQPGDKLV